MFFLLPWVLPSSFYRSLSGVWSPANWEFDMFKHMIKSPEGGLNSNWSAKWSLLHWKWEYCIFRPFGFKNWASLLYLMIYLVWLRISLHSEKDSERSMQFYYILRCSCAVLGWCISRPSSSLKRAIKVWPEPAHLVNRAGWTGLLISFLGLQANLWPD